jgi:malonyl-CoA/methylmalonyl-CoA synthetase
MRLFISGSAPLQVETFDAWQERTGHTILERYGMSETVMLTSNPYREQDGERRRGTVGFPLPGVGVRVRDDSGAPVRPVRSAASRSRAQRVRRLLAHAREDPGRFTADGWFKTGDVGKIDERGYVSSSGAARTS